MGSRWFATNPRPLARRYHPIMNPSTRRTGYHYFLQLLPFLRDGTLLRACQEVANAAAPGADGPLTASGSRFGRKSRRWSGKGGRCMDGGRWRPGNEVPTDGLSLSVLPDVVFTDDGCDVEELTPERWESICESAASGAGEWAASHYIKTLLTLRAGEARVVVFTCGAQSVSLLLLRCMSSKTHNSC